MFLSIYLTDGQSAPVCQFAPHDHETTAGCCVTPEPGARNLISGSRVHGSSSTTRGIPAASQGVCWQQLGSVEPLILKTGNLMPASRSALLCMSFHCTCWNLGGCIGMQATVVGAILSLLIPEGKILNFSPLTVQSGTSHGL